MPLTNSDEVERGGVCRSPATHTWFAASQVVARGVAPVDVRDPRRLLLAVARRATRQVAVAQQVVDLARSRGSGPSAERSREIAAAASVERGVRDASGFSVAQRGEQPVRRGRRRDGCPARASRLARASRRRR